MHCFRSSYLLLDWSEGIPKVGIQRAVLANHYSESASIAASIRSFLSLTQIHSRVREIRFELSNEEREEVLKLPFENSSDFTMAFNAFVQLWLRSKATLQSLMPHTIRLAHLRVTDLALRELSSFPSVRSLTLDNVHSMTSIAWGPCYTTSLPAITELTFGNVGPQVQWHIFSILALIGQSLIVLRFQDPTGWRSDEILYGPLEASCRFFTKCGLASSPLILCRQIAEVEMIFSQVTQKGELDVVKLSLRLQSPLPPGALVDTGLEGSRWIRTLSTKRNLLPFTVIEESEELPWDEIWRKDPHLL